MSWLSEIPVKKRPIVLLEDHLYHIGEVLELLERQMPSALSWLTVLCIDRPGPDTQRAVGRWLERWPTVQVAAAVDGLEHPRYFVLDESIFSQAHDLARAAASLLRPGGLILQDIQLETLNFIPRDRWWESIYVATSLRGMFPRRQPVCRFLSNKKGYEATFGCDLLDAGFDPRDVLDKRELHKVLIPTLRAFLRRSMPLDLEVHDPGLGDGGASLASRVGDAAEDRAEVEAELDLVLWELPGGGALGGRVVRSTTSKPQLRLKPGSPEELTWRALMADALDSGNGVPVLEVGRRLAPELAGRAEVTNCAARHIHVLRSRLSAPDMIRTADHAYRLDRRLRLGRISPPPTTS